MRVSRFLEGGATVTISVSGSTLPYLVTIIVVDEVNYQLFTLGSSYSGYVFLNSQPGSTSVNIPLDSNYHFVIQNQGSNPLTALVKIVTTPNVAVSLLIIFIVSVASVSIFSKIYDARPRRRPRQSAPSTQGTNQGPETVQPAPPVPGNERVSSPIQSRPLESENVLRSCSSCGAAITMPDWKFCSTCGASLSRQPAAASSITEENTRSSKEDTGICMVCKIGLQPSDQIVYCPLCGNPAHKTHMLEWLHVKGTCPICGQHLKPKEIGS